jgi:hypothetical protein
MERLEVVAWNVEDLDGAVGETLPAGNRGLRVTAVGEPGRDVCDALRLVALAGAEQDERRAEAGGRVGDVLPEHARVHRELFLDQRAELGAGGARVEINDSVDKGVGEGDVVNWTWGVDEEDALDLDPSTRELEGDLIRCNTSE